MMILITGASGNVGREVLIEVAKTGRPIRAAFQNPAKATVPAGVEKALVDYGQPATLRSALDGVDAVFLVGPPTEQLIQLERKATDAIAQSNVKRVVKLSAMGGRDAIFPRQHVESEEYIAATGLPYTFLRPNGLMQNLINYSLPTIKSISRFFGCEGDGRVSQIDTRDVAAVAAKVLVEDGHIGKIYTLTGPEALSSHEVASQLSEVVGREIHFVNLEPDDLRTSLLAAGVTAWNADALIDLQTFYRAGKASLVTGDVETLVGRKPCTLRQFLIEHRNVFDPVGAPAV